jgi:hypothetical protein
MGKFYYIAIFSLIRKGEDGLKPFFREEDG